MMINGKNYYNEDSLKEMCKALDEGKDIQIHIDCIGHTRSFVEGAHYASELYSIYGDRLERLKDSVFYHSYKLKEMRNIGN